MGYAARLFHYFVFLGGTLFLKKRRSGLARPIALPRPSLGQGQEPEGTRREA
jgi:hypothetical protein